MKKMLKYTTVGTGAAFAALSLIALPLQQAAADEDYEWDPTWGLHEEEWYDPSDWFNDDGTVDVEDLNEGWGYDDPYYYDDTFWTEPDYTYDYGYDTVEFDPDYSAVYVQWDPVDQDWAEVPSDMESSDKARKEAQEKNKSSKGRVNKKDVMTVKGTIQGVAEISPKGAKQPHKFVILEAAEDKSILVDLGSKEMKNVSLEKGKKLQVRGPRSKAGGKYVLVAQQVSQMQDKSSAKN